MKALTRYSGKLSSIGIALLNHVWVLAFLIPVLYLVYDPSYFNKDDNFAQFTPVFKYAFDAMVQGKFPWMSPGELNIQVAQSPYYAIFSPVLFASFLLTQLLNLEPYWIVNFWAISNIYLMNILLLKFASKLNIAPSLKSTLVLGAGIATFASGFAASWYYTLPYQILLIWKIYYWYRFLHQRENKLGDDAILLITTYLAVFGGNPQLFAYVMVVEICFLLPFIDLKIFKLWLRNQCITLLLFAPYIYCYLEFWRFSWRTVHNTHAINIFNFLARGIPAQKQEGGGQPLWALICLVLTVYAPIRWSRADLSNRISYSLAVSSTFLLFLACLDIGGMLGGILPQLSVLTAPMKWWFFGGITSVLAVCIWGQSLRKANQILLASVMTTLLLIYLYMNLGVAAWKWGSVNYTFVNQSIKVISQFADTNSRISQVSHWRSFEKNPSRNLLLNTWLVGNYGNLIFAKDYETIQSGDNLHPENIGKLKKDSVTDYVLPHWETFQSLGVSGLWVNASEYQPAEFSPNDYEILYKDNFNFFAKLENPGKIVECEKSKCNAEIFFHSDSIDINLENFHADDIVSVKITPYQKFVGFTSTQAIELFRCESNWLCFKPIAGQTQYEIRYKDQTFIYLLIGSNVLLFLLLISCSLRVYSRSKAVN